MSKLIKLSSQQHSELKVDLNSAVAFAARQHLLNLRVNEVAQAICNFPVFFNKNIHSGYWNLSAITSFVVGANLFVQNNQWQAIYRPSSMQNYPFYLIKSNDENEEFSIGIDPSNPAFSTHNGEPLFESNGQESLYLSRVKSLLETDINNDIQTFQFGKTLEEMNLLKSINIVVQYHDQSPQTLTGLYTINEDQLHSLSDEQLGELNRRGYLTPIQGILLSIAQLNGLIQKNNQLHKTEQIQSIKLEVTK